jgi:hypothetical protein
MRSTAPQTALMPPSVASSLVSRTAWETCWHPATEGWGSVVVDSDIGAYVVLMWTTTCVTGDSGAPWLTTMGPNSTYPGDVIAHGQHRGAVSSESYHGCVWVPVTYISSKVEASLLLP